MRILVVGSFAFVIYLFPLWKPPEIFIHAAAPWFITLILTVLPVLLTIRHFLFIHYVPLSLDFIFLFSNLIFLRGGESDDSDQYCQEDEERRKKMIRKKARPKKEKRTKKKKQKDGRVTKEVTTVTNSNFRRIGNLVKTQVKVLNAIPKPPPRTTSLGLPPPPNWMLQGLTWTLDPTPEDIYQNRTYQSFQDENCLPGCPPRCKAKMSAITPRK